MSGRCVGCERFSVDLACASCASSECDKVTADLRAKLAEAERQASENLSLVNVAIARAEAAEAKLAAAEKERDFFDAERMKVVAQLETAEAALAAMTAERDETEAKYAEMALRYATLTSKNARNAMAAIALADTEAALAAEKEGRRKAEADNAELRRALKEDGETMQKAIVIHEKCHVERNEQRMRAVAAEQEAFGARSQLLKGEERSERLRKYAVAIQNGGHYEALQPGDLDAPTETP